MNDFAPPFYDDRGQPPTDPTERDSQGWVIKPVSDRELQHIDILDRRRTTWNVEAVGRSLTILQGQLDPESRLVVVGWEMPEIVGQPSFVVLTATIAREVPGPRGRIPNADEQELGVLIAFADIPTPGELQGFFTENSTEIDPMSEWPSDGEFPYIVLSGDKPGVVEFGVMDVRSQIRTKAAREYSDGLHDDM